MTAPRASGVAVLLVALALVVGCSARMDAVVMWEKGRGPLHLGSAPMPADICQREMPELLALYEADRTNYGQRADDPRTWITGGLCVAVPPEKSSARPR